MTVDITLLISLAAGALALFFGRRLYWLFVGVAGFTAGVALAEQVQGVSPEARLIVGIVVGVVLALLVVSLQKPVLAVGGFLAFGAAGLALVRLLGLRAEGGLTLLVFVVAGIIGAILMFAIFDWALIVISSVNGATTIVGSLASARVVLALSGTLGLVAVLVLVGISFQAQQLRNG